MGIGRGKFFMANLMAALLSAISLLAANKAFSEDMALIRILDVCGGSFMKAVNPGEIKSLRILKFMKPAGNSCGTWECASKQSPAVGYYDGALLVPLGEVQVGIKGSAQFYVQAESEFLIQALDAYGDMVQTSPLLASPKKGQRADFPNMFSAPELGKDAGVAGENIAGYSGGLSSGPFSFKKYVEPILENHCADCHDEGCSGAAKMVLSGDKGIVFSKSYTEIVWKEGVSANPDGIGKTRPANAWGAKQSKIIWMLRDGHGGCELSDGEFFALRLWIDLNVPYYDTVSSAYMESPSGRSPLSFGELKRLFDICKMPKVLNADNKTLILARKYPIEIISFDRPESSEILINVPKQSDSYMEALSIIRKGAERLKLKPREDM